MEYCKKDSKPLKVNIINQPPESAVKKLLSSANLDSSDLTSEHLRHFFGVGTEEKLEGVVGLELFDTVGLLRSLAVDSSRRGIGLGSKLVAHAEDCARSRGVKSLYLLTVTAEDYFLHRGYRRISREEAPAAIMATTQFSEICPMSSAFMAKQL